MKELQKFDPTIWQGRKDEEDGLDGIRMHQIIQEYQEAEAYKQVLLGFGSDEGVKRNKGREGTAEAPNEIRKALANLPVHFNPIEKSIADAGNVLCIEGDLERARLLQIDKVGEILSKNQLPIVIGGGHETSLGNYLALAKHYQNIAIINIDAHFDLRSPSPKTSSGTPFYEMHQFCEEENRIFDYSVLGVQENGNTMALFKRAEVWKVNYHLADEIHFNFEQMLSNLRLKLTSADAVYLSLDMDVFDVAYAPGVSAPSINGLTPFQVKYLVKLIAKSGKLRLFDLVEVNPSLDRDNQTSKLAAHMILEAIKQA
ncbi:formimidoylglutamase [Weeksella virosa]|uniref:formimidoylglutamase n=1 Tax=Weeksella virosa TaxID=1014 RepID=UPI0025564643|nr:formimidoylglutamase [Weeksella virosa]MDK7374122.1 formimidoylglutamase [Weeksella virosa]